MDALIAVQSEPLYVTGCSLLRQPGLFKIPGYVFCSAQIIVLRSLDYIDKIDHRQTYPFTEINKKSQKLRTVSDHQCRICMKEVSKLYFCTFRGDNKADSVLVNVYSTNYRQND